MQVLVSINHRISTHTKRKRLYDGKFVQIIGSDDPRTGEGGKVTPDVIDTLANKHGGSSDKWLSYVKSS